MSTQTYRLLNFLLLGALFAGSVMVYPRLPERFPIHFDLSGQPDGWQDRSLVSWLMLPAIAAGMAGLLELATRFSEDNPQLWNVPDKQRFLALTPAERAPVVERLKNFMAMVGMASTALLGVIQVSIYHAAVTPEPRMPPYALGAVGVHVAVLVIAGLRMNSRISAYIREVYRRRAMA